MSKSRYSKTKAAGMLCGMERIKDYKFSQAGRMHKAAGVENRQVRRMRERKGK